MRMYRLVPGTVLAVLAVAVLAPTASAQREADVRPGGEYRNSDGDHGEYTAVEPPSRVAFTWENEGHCPGTRVEVTFEEVEPERTAVVLEHTGFESAADREAMKGGWAWALDSYQSYVETGRAIPHEEWLSS